MEQFISARTKVTVRDTQLLRRSEEKRHHFRLSIELSTGDGVLNGMPQWIQDNYTLMQKSSSCADVTRLNKRLESMALEFYPTPKGRHFFTGVVGATLSSFKMVRVGEGDDAAVVLHFSAHFSARKEIHDWTYDYKTADCYMEFEQQQRELDMAGTAAVDEVEAPESGLPPLRDGHCVECGRTSAQCVCVYEGDEDEVASSQATATAIH